jgi:hypothetical protein
LRSTVNIHTAPVNKSNQGVIFQGFISQNHINATVRIW